MSKKELVEKITKELDGMSKERALAEINFLFGCISSNEDFLRQFYKSLMYPKVIGIYELK